MLRLYKDAQPIGERAVTLADDDAIIMIAPKDPWESVRQFEGEIRDLTIWKGALGESGIKTLRDSAKLP